MCRVRARADCGVACSYKVPSAFQPRCPPDKTKWYRYDGLVRCRCAASCASVPVILTTSCACAVHGGRLVVHSRQERVPFVSISFQARARPAAPAGAPHRLEATRNQEVLACACMLHCWLTRHSTWRSIKHVRGEESQSGSGATGPRGGAARRAQRHGLLAASSPCDVCGERVLDSLGPDAMLTHVSAHVRQLVAAHDEDALRAIVTHEVAARHFFENN